MHASNVRVPVPRLGNFYDLLSIDTATRYRHKGIVPVEGIVWEDCLCYEMKCPVFAYPLPADVSWQRIWTALRWLHTCGKALRNITPENIFATYDTENGGELYATLYVGENIVPATEEKMNENVNQLRQYAQEEGEFEDGVIVWDYDDLEESDIVYPGRDAAKNCLDSLIRNCKEWELDHFFYAFDIFQRLNLISSGTAEELTLVATNVVARTFYPAQYVAYEKQHVLERHLLLSFSGVFFSPLRAQIHTFGDMMQVINRYCLNFDSTMYFLAERGTARKEDEQVLHSTLRDVLSKK
jgi:hypothetical protein